jgi:outer membrane protein TolC
MKNKLLLVSLLGANLFALDINSAIDSAMKNNFALKQKQYIVDESKASLDGAYNGYLPKVDLSYSFNDSNYKIGQKEKHSVATAKLSYNLFNGFYDRYNIKANENRFDASKYTLKASREDLKLNVKKAYINYLLKQKETKTNSDALELYKIQYNDSSNFFNQGLIAKNELLEVEVQMLNAKQSYQSSKSALKIAKQELENIMGQRVASTENIEELTKAEENIKIGELKLDNRSEIKSLKSNIQSFYNSAKTVTSNFYPKLNASMSYNKYGDAEMPKDAENYPDSQTIGSVNLNWNIFNGGSDSSSMRAYKMKANQSLMALEDLKLQIRLQYENAKENYETAKLNLQSATKAKESAKLNYEIVSSKVKEGLSSNKDLIDANYLLTKSKQDFYSAYYNKYLAIATLKRVIEE